MKLLILFVLALCCVQSAYAITSRCPTGKCQSRGTNDTCPTGDEQACACIPSELGAPCTECGGYGYIADATCVCNLNNEDPNVACRVPFPQNATVTLTRVASICDCTCHFRKELGWFKPIASDFHYGGPNPLICRVCTNDAVGPPVGVLVEDPFLAPLGTCTAFGGPDPLALNDTSFRVCSNRGTWSSLDVRCTCDFPWLISETPYDNPNIADQKIYTCGACRPLYGPRSGPNMCSSVYTPDPLTGVDASCGGHGTYTQGACACYSNSTFGWWNLTTLVDTFTVPIYTSPSGGATTLMDIAYSAQTCDSCQMGFSVLTGCTS